MFPRLHKHLRRICGLAAGGAWLCLGAPARAEAPANDSAGFHIRHWTSEDGLPQNNIVALAQTPDGYLWIGTWFGLARFDGVRFTVFNEMNTPALRSQTVNALVSDSAGNLWIGTQDGLVQYRAGRWTRFDAQSGLPDQHVWRLVSGCAGGIWVHAGAAVFRWQGDRVADSKLHPVGDMVARSFYPGESGGLIMQMGEALEWLTCAGEMQRVPVPSGVPRGTWGGAWWQPGRRRFALSLNDGLWVHNGDSWRVIQVGPSRADHGHFMFEDKSGALWVNRREAGFWRCREAAVEPVKLGEHGAEASVSCMLEDAGGNLWMGTAQGLFQLRSTLIQAVTPANGLPNDECWSVCEAPDGAIWVETKSGLARVTPGQVRTFGDEPARNPQKSLLVDANAWVWLGNGHDGVVAWQPGVRTNYFWSAGRYGEFTGVTLHSLYRDRGGRVWAGTGRGAAWFEDGQPAAAWGDYGLPTNEVRAICQTRDGAMWFGTWAAGMVRWDNRPSPGGAASAPATQPRDAAPPRRFTTADGLADDRVFAFHEDPDGVLWIGTHNGLSRYQGGRFFTYRTEQGLLDNLINHLEEDEFGRLWFSCNRGIFRMDRAELNAVAEGRKAVASAIVYGTADGMPNPETNGEHQPAGCKARDGRLWFPTMLGIVVVDPRTVKDIDLPVPVVVEEVLADGETVWSDGVGLGEGGKPEGGKVGSPAPGKPVPPIPARLPTSSGSLHLPPGRARVLQFRYTASSFADPRRVRFRYRLAGLESGWRPATDERVAYYTSLHPGDYQFEVEAANHHGVWSDTPTTFAFSLAPHFWQTRAFEVACGLGVVGLAAGIQSYRLRWQRRLLKLDEQRALANERTRIARDLHDDLGTALTGLALELDVIGRSANGATHVAGPLGATATRTRQLAERMREVVWTVNPACDTVSSLASFLEQQVAQFLGAADLRVRLDFPEDIPALPLGAEARHQLALSVREALTNVVRHARAGEVAVSLAIAGDTLSVQVKDNGCGFVVTEQAGHGLANLRARLAQVGGSFECVSTPGAGATLTFRLPLLRAAPRPPAS